MRHLRYGTHCKFIRTKPIWLTSGESRLLLVLQNCVRICVRLGEPNSVPPNANTTLVDTIRLAPLRKISRILAYISRRSCSAFPVAESRHGCSREPYAAHVRLNSPFLR